MCSTYFSDCMNKVVVRTRLRSSPLRPRALTTAQPQKFIAHFFLNFYHPLSPLSQGVILRVSHVLRVWRLRTVSVTKAMANERRKDRYTLTSNTLQWAYSAHSTQQIICIPALEDSRLHEGVNDARQTIWCTPKGSRNPLWSTEMCICLLDVYLCVYLMDGSMGLVAEYMTSFQFLYLWYTKRKLLKWPWCDCLLLWCEWVSRMRGCSINCIIAHYYKTLCIE